MDGWIILSRQTQMITSIIYFPPILNRSSHLCWIKKIQEIKMKNCQTRFFGVHFLLKELFSYKDSFHYITSMSD